MAGDKRVIGALDPVDFERSRDTVSGQILQPGPDHDPVARGGPWLFGSERPLSLGVPDMNLALN